LPADGQVLGWLCLGRYRLLRPLLDGLRDLPGTAQDVVAEGFKKGFFPLSYLCLFSGSSALLVKAGP
jgi:hypothetical protein